jgi:photosystem II stability/assembly factor-like uncharacterized protein
MRRHGRRVSMGVLALMVAVGVAMEAGAAPGIVWERVEGIHGASVYSLAATPDGALLASTRSGIYRSMDQGESWTPFAFDGARTETIAVEGNVVYVSAAVGTRQLVHRSDDGGLAWSVADLNFVPRGLLVRDGVVYGVRTVGGGSMRVYRSADRGDTWTDASIGNATGVGVAVTDAFVYAVSHDTVYRSANGQDGWEAVGPNLVDDRLVSATTLNETLYVAGETTGVYRFDADGEAWTRAPLDGIEVEWLRAAGDALYAGTSDVGLARQPGFVLSRDGGATWGATNMGEGVWPSDVLRVGRRTYVASHAGVFVSEDDGVSWRNVSRGLSGMGLDSIAAAGERVYVGSNAGVHASEDGGRTWRRTSLYRHTPVLAASGQTVYAATSSRGIFRSDDAGHTWREVNDGVPIEDNGERMYFPSTPREILLTPSHIWVAYYHGAYLRSADGESWEPPSGPTLESGFPYFPSGNGPLSIGEDGGVLYVNAHNFTTRSFDGGETWEQLWGAGSVRGSDMHTFDGHLYIVGERGVFRWDEGSRHWLDASQGLPLGDESNPNDSDRFAGTRFASLGKSLYVGSYLHGIHRLYAGTNEWTTAGLEGLRVWSLLTYNGGLLAGTSEGLLRATVDQNVAVEPRGKGATAWADVKLAALTPEQSALLPNYPNRFNPETWIPFDLSEPAQVSIRIYDAGGRVVRMLTLGSLSPGRYRERDRAAHWDGRDATGSPVASGVYVVEFVAGSYSERRRIVVRK